ncbi:hypothetical protein AUJ95_06665 [Candidatus Desantisbacteria bacterium CG2_30_40_21]|uniref:Flagellar protein n=5 Tax=unclassified Candidatus Desantisiibacteriota TaxID=3106372 RepID=A0A2M7J8Z2_9BACT|nr:MAG: hypothetical protein AUJ95_06665 [Candidatus Desantisbacteria bacterium CG2_30_40_21]PIP39905.1 MAG: hypothetical protein COX18_08570 [Candidatus Desantisbacteria bacterium CG23_combo_of_CG06-09_8_20_14_all_40_23]PIX15869.1 MAG: hypothetical protein COZ71_09240 [Candidatus Desantisbacteria bacterium CG_4_8_14_3_um_filter_40_12]PIY18695.1 MAG: hypothetical protein COZ13_09280 [Candidatus Desantisbacteria bacterium CG_4_10_14_3_um_filter_40_18]PJB29928.1 MAG: hypothetical protein CO110_03
MQQLIFICLLISLSLLGRIFETEATETMTTVATTQAVSTQPTPTIQKTTGTEDQPVFTGNKNAPSSKGYKVNLFAVIVKTIMALIVIGLLIVGLLRFFFKNKVALFSGTKCINALASHPLSPNKYIQIVEIGNKLIILGITDSNINLLCEITDTDTIDLIKLQCSSEPPSTSLPFIEHLTGSVKKVLGNFGHMEGGKSKGYEEKVEFLKTQRDRLRRLEG